MKKQVLVIAALMAVCLVAVFARGKAGAVRKGKTLLEQGLSLSALMKEKAGCGAYIDMFLGPYADPSLREKIKEIGAGDVSDPTAVYRINDGLGTEIFDLMSGNSMAEFNLEEVSPALKDEVEKRIFYSIPSFWTGFTVNAEGLAVVSLLSSEKTFDSNELSKNCIYVFTFKDAYPVAVSFIRGEGISVCARATFILDKDFPASYFDMVLENGHKIDVEKIQ
ncbi:MAG: hypothetical protein J5817_06130 [Treponema sp.]|nr:hypothetical protein [Treponema sp.]